MKNLVQKANDDHFINKEYFYKMFNKSNNLKKNSNNKNDIERIEYNFGNAVDFIKFAGAYYAPEGYLIENCDLDLECDPNKGQQTIIKGKDNTKFVPHIMPVIGERGDFTQLARTNLSIDDMINKANNKEIDIYLNQRAHFITESHNENLMISAVKMLYRKTNSVPQSYYELITNTKAKPYCGTYLTDMKFAKEMLNNLYVGIDQTSVTGNERIKLHHNGVKDEKPSYLKFLVNGPNNRLIAGKPTHLILDQTKLEL